MPMKITIKVLILSCTIKPHCAEMKWGAVRLDSRQTQEMAELVHTAEPVNIVMEGIEIRAVIQKCTVDIAGEALKFARFDFSPAQYARIATLIASEAEVDCTIQRAQGMLTPGDDPAEVAERNTAERKSIPRTSGKTATEKLLEQVDQDMADEAERLAAEAKPKKKKRQRTVGQTRRASA